MAAATAIRQKKLALARMANAKLDADYETQAKLPDRLAAISRVLNSWAEPWPPISDSINS
jgi:hypothetical protein